MVVVEVDVEVLVEEDVAGLLVVVLLVVGAMVVVVVVVVGPIVVVVDVVLADLDTRLLVPAGDSAVLEGELLGASHPVATRTTVMIGSVTSLVNGSATRDRDATPAVFQRPSSSSRPIASGRHIATGESHRRVEHRSPRGRRIYSTRHWIHAATIWKACGLCLLDSVEPSWRLAHEPSAGRARPGFRTSASVRVSPWRGSRRVRPNDLESVIPASVFRFSDGMEQ